MFFQITLVRSQVPQLECDLWSVEPMQLDAQFFAFVFIKVDYDAKCIVVRQAVTNTVSGILNDLAIFFAG